MTDSKKDFKKLLSLSKNNAEVIIKSMEKVLYIYKFFIVVLIVTNLILGYTFYHYINKNTEMSIKTSKSFTYSINKITKGLTNVKRSDVRMD